MSRVESSTTVRNSSSSLAGVGLQSDPISASSCKNNKLVAVATSSGIEDWCRALALLQATFLSKLHIYSRLNAYILI